MSVYILAFIIEILPILYIIKVFKEAKSSFEKSIYLLVIFAFLFPGFVYLIDDLNVPSHLGWTKNIYNNDWFGFLTNYLSAIFGFCISSFFTLFITKKQIYETNNENREERRINNMPLLQYSFPIIDNDNRRRIKYNILKTKLNDDVTVDEEINFEIKNVGMNAVKKCYVKISGDILSDSYLFEVINPEYGSSVIHKDKSNIIRFDLGLKMDNIYNFNFKIYYQDLISNWYEQDLELEYNLTNIVYNNQDVVAIKHFEVKDELFLENGLPSNFKDIA